MQLASFYFNVEHGGGDGEEKGAQLEGAQALNRTWTISSHPLETAHLYVGDHTIACGGCLIGDAVLDLG